MTRDETIEAMYSAPDKRYPAIYDQFIAPLKAENARLRAMIRVNALRYIPGCTHETIDAMIDAALTSEATPAPSPTS